METAREFARFCDQRRQAQALADLVMTAPREIVCHICVLALDHLGAGIPEADTMWSDLRADAAFWADTASPAELREYLGAALRKITEGDLDAAIALAPRKRLLVDLWAGMPEADKRKFLARVDPKGLFRGAA